MPLVYGEGRVKALRRLETDYNAENGSLSRAFPLEIYLSITALRDNQTEKHLKRQLTRTDPLMERNILKRQKVHGNQGFELAYNSSSVHNYYTTKSGQSPCITTVRAELMAHYIYQDKKISLIPAPLYRSDATTTLSIATP